MRLFRATSGLVGGALLLAACGGSEPSGPPKVAQVTVTSFTQQVEVGATIQLSASTRDAKGNALTGRTITWTASPATTATVDGSGVVTGVAAGQATITATSEGVAGTLSVTVVPVPVATVAIANRTPAVRQGETLQLSAVAQDAIGRPLNERAITWSSENVTVATVSNTGLVSGVLSGTTYIRAESEGKRDSVALRVRSLVSPTVGTTAPATWTPATQATIAGTNFSVDAGGNEVFVNGVRAAISAATATSLTITVPAAASLPCSPTGPIPIVVVANGDSALGTANLAMATQRQLAVGQSVMYTSTADLACNEFPVTGGKYLITAFNTAPLLGTRASFQLLGAARATAAATSLSAIRGVQAVQPTLGPLATQEVSALDRFRRGHLASMELNQRLLSTKGRPRPALERRLSRERAGAARSPAARTTLASVAPVPPPQVGEMQWKRMMRTYGNYNTFDSVRVRVVYSGPNLVIMEDSLNPLYGTMDAEYQRIGAEFDTKMFPYLSYFGDPLAVDTLTDNNARVIAIFSRKVNAYSVGGGSLLGFVTLCDFFANDDPDPQFNCAPSNEGEYFYAFVPNPGATGSGAFSLDRWRALVRSTLIHEMKHVIMFAERIARDASFTEESWLEEATAQQASELWSRDMYGRFGPGADITWATGPRCDYAAQSAACPDPFEGIMHHFGFLYAYYNSNETKSMLTQSGITPDFVIYGSSWSFARWATDTYSGGNESRFLRELVQQQNDRGIQNISARTGRPWAELVGLWSMATLADNYPGAAIADARLRLTSWNTRDIFAEMSARLAFVDANGNRTPAFPKPWPLNVRTPSFGTFPDFVRNVVSLPGGTFAAWELSGTQTVPQVLAIRALNGGQPPANVGLMVLRVQ